MPCGVSPRENAPCSAAPCEVSSSDAAPCNAALGGVAPCGVSLPDSAPCSATPCSVAPCDGDASKLSGSVVSQILPLLSDCILFPGHNYSGRTSVSVAEEKEFNPGLGNRTNGFFVELMNAQKIRRFSGDPVQHCFFFKWGVRGAAAPRSFLI